MIRQYTRKSNLKIQLEGDFENTVTRELVQILEPDDSYDFMRSPELMTNAEVAAHLAKAKQLHSRYYDYLLAYINTTGGPQYYSAYTITIHPSHAFILPTAVQFLKSFTLEKRTFHTITSMESASYIYYYVPSSGSSTNTGCIAYIWQLPLESMLRTFIFVKRHAHLSPTQEKWNPYSKYPCSLLQANLVLQELSNDFHIIEPQHIICHLATLKLTKDSHPNIYRKIHKPVTVITWALDRRRRGPV